MLTNLHLTRIVPSVESLEKQWVAERDKQLAAWFAEGRRDDDVFLLAQGMGYDLSIEGLQQKRAELYSQTCAIMAAKGPEFLRHIPRSNVVVRVTELDETCNRLVKGLLHCETESKWTLMPRLVEVLLRAQAQIKSEVSAIPQIDTAQEKQKTMLRSMSPELRRQLTDIGEQFREVMERAYLEQKEGLAVIEAGEADAY